MMSQPGAGIAAFARSNIKGGDALPAPVAAKAPQ